MERQPEIRSRVSAELLADARAAAGVPASMTTPEFIRYAFALIAGKPDPLALAVIINPSRFKPNTDTPAVITARNAYRASLAGAKPIPGTQLVSRYGVTIHEARRIVAECKAERQAAA